MKRKIFCSFYCVNNIFSADEADTYINFAEKNKIWIRFDWDYYGIYYLSGENVKLKKREYYDDNYKLNIEDFTNFALYDKDKKTTGEYKVNLADLLKDKKWEIMHYLEEDKDNSYTYKKEDFDHYYIELAEKQYFNENSKLILNNQEISLRDKYTLKNQIRTYNYDGIKEIIRELKKQIEDIEHFNEDLIIVESYKIENGVSRTMEEGEQFRNYIADYIDNVKNGKKTELVINSFANYEYDYICLNDDLDKKYHIDRNSKKYNEFKENVENFIEELNKNKDKKLLSDEDLTKSIQEKLGNDIIIKGEDDLFCNKKSIKIIINNINNYKEFINPKKIHLSFEAPDGYVFEDTFNSEVDIDFSKRDDINGGTTLYDCVLKISKIDLKTIENEIKYKELDEDDSKLSEYKHTNISYNNYYKIRFKKPINGITKEYDKNNLLIKIEFNIDDSIKANYELDGNFNNITSQNNKIKKGKKISDLKEYIDNNLAKNITNYELKEDNTVVTDNNKALKDKATYIFTFKEGSNCIKEKPKKTDPKKTEHTENPTENSTEENDTNNNINNNKGKCLCSGNNNKTNKKGCC